MPPFLHLFPFFFLFPVPFQIVLAYVLSLGVLPSVTVSGREGKEGVVHFAVFQFSRSGRQHAAKQRMSISGKMEETESTQRAETMSDTKTRHVSSTRIARFIRQIRQTYG